MNSKQILRLLTFSAFDFETLSAIVGYLRNCSYEDFLKWSIVVEDIGTCADVEGCIDSSDFSEFFMFCAQIVLWAERVNEEIQDALQEIIDSWTSKYPVKFVCIDDTGGYFDRNQGGFGVPATAANVTVEARLNATCEEDMRVFFESWLKETVTAFSPEFALDLLTNHLEFMVAYETLLVKYLR